MIEAAGAPTDQGQAQGRALRDSITAVTARLRAQQPLLAWLAARRFVRRTSTRATERQLPGLAERSEGIARGAGVRPATLALVQAWQRVQASGFHDGCVLQICFETPRALEGLLLLRASRPDAGGFPSVELTCATWAGCLAGLNAEGLGVLCLEDRDWSAPSLRLLAQEFLFRARDLGAGIDHLRRRGSYLGSSGLLVVGDAAGVAVALRFAAGRLHAGDPPGAGRRVAEPSAELDLRARRIRWNGSEESAPEPLPEAELAAAQ